MSVLFCPAKLYGNLVPNVVAGLCGEAAVFRGQFYATPSDRCCVELSITWEHCTLTPYVVYNMMHNPGNRREHRIAVLS